MQYYTESDLETRIIPDQKTHCWQMKSIVEEMWCLTRAVLKSLEKTVDVWQLHHITANLPLEPKGFHVSVNSDKNFTF